MYISSGCSCPACEERNENSSRYELPGLMMEKTYHKKFSAGKAAVGVLLTGALLGAAAGALGKEETYYKCSKCGFTCDNIGNPVEVE